MSLLHLYSSVGPAAGTLSGAPPAVPAFLTASQPPGPVAVVAQPPLSSHSAETPVVSSAPAPQLAASTTQGPSPAGAASPQTSLSEAQAGAKEPPALVLPSTGLLGIPASLVAKIKAGKFIDLGDLLPEALEWAFERSSEDKKDEGKKKRFAISSVADWTLAFATFMAVAVHFKPCLAAPLATYMTIVARLAREVQGQVWLRYDKLFRQAVAVNPALPWDRREPDVGLAAMSEQPRPAAFNLTTPRSTAPRGGSETEICKRFTRGECHSQACKFRHACMLCQSPGHPARDCFMLRPPARRPPPPSS